MGNSLVRLILLAAAFFLPAGISVVLWNNLLHHDRTPDRNDVLVEYLVFFLLVHLLDVYVLTWRTSIVETVLSSSFRDVAFAVIFDVLLWGWKRKDAAPVQNESSLSVEREWFVWGLVMSLGIIGIGELIFHLIRPAYIVRYSYPVSPVIWLLFGVSLPKLKSGRSLCAAVAVSTLLVCVPQMVNTYEKQRQADELCASTAEYLRNTIGENELMVTDVSHLDWTILDYYVPGVDYVYVDHVPKETDLSGYAGYWLIWESDLSKDETEELEKDGYAVRERMHNGNLGTLGVHIYQLIPENE